MSKILFCLLGLLLALSACTQRVTCPAYQSSFIHDKEVLKKRFSYFEQDSIPKVFTASTSKNRYLVAVPQSYRKKLRSLQTVEMKRIYPQRPDSLKGKPNYPDPPVDSTAVLADSLSTSTDLTPADSAYAITKKKEKYNVDQDNYMWYFREVLVLPDVRAAVEANKRAKEKPKVEENGAKEEKKGFFKNLFKKNKSDSTAVEEPPAPKPKSVPSTPEEKPDTSQPKK